MLEVKNIQFWRHDTLIINDLSMTIPSGKMTGVIGPNGAGKSTLLQLIAGLLAPSHGSIGFNGQDLIHCTAIARARFIGWLAQKNNIIWPLSVRDVLRLGTVDGSTVDDARIISVLERLGLSRFSNRSVLSLSGGEQGLVMLARLLISDAPCLLVDEPLQSLDPAHQFHVLSLLKEEAAAGRCILMVCHDLTLAARYCERLVLIDQGRAMMHDDTQKVIGSGLIETSFNINLQRFSANDDGETYSALVAMR